MSTSRTSTLSPQVLAAASSWFVEFNEGEVSVSQREEFVQWLRDSPEHVRAYVQISAHWEEGRTLGRKDGLTVEQLMELGCSDAKSLPLDREWGSLFPAEDEGRAAYVHQSRSKAQWVLPLAASIFILAASFWLYERRNLYETEIGEQRSIKLADGSTIDMNSRSRVRVNFSPSGRDVELLQGQALFSVAKDKVRPFVVHSDDTQVRAIGTRFDVYRKATGTVVTVVEGRVAVSNDSIIPSTSEVRPEIQSRPGAVAAKPIARADPSIIELAAGQQLTLTQAEIKIPTAVDVTAATAWTQKQIIFRDAPLTEVVEEFNRYNTRKMRIADPDILSIRISGAFSSTDPTSLLRALDLMGAFSIQETSDEVRISGKQGVLRKENFH